MSIRHVTSECAVEVASRQRNENASDEGRQYRFELEEDVQLEQQLKWMDGHRYMFAVNQQSYIVDFDGSNFQMLVTTRLPNGPFFDRDYDNVFTVESSKQNADKTALTMTIIKD